MKRFRLRSGHFGKNFWLQIFTKNSKFCIWLQYFIYLVELVKGFTEGPIRFKKSRFQNLLIATALIFTAALKRAASNFSTWKFRPKNFLNFPCKKNFGMHNRPCILFRFGMASAGMTLIRLSVRITSWTYQGRPSGMWTNFASSSVCTHWALLSCSSQMHPDGHWDWAKVNNPTNIVSIIS